MAGTVIDQLVVQLGLDPKGFGKGLDDEKKSVDAFREGLRALGVDESKLNDEQKALLATLEKLATQTKDTTKALTDQQKRVAQFKEIVKGLGIDESKLDDKQKLSLRSLEKLATQSQKTGKELKATGAAGGEFWDVFKKGALGFGAALIGYGLERVYQQTVSTAAALGNLAPNLNISTTALQSWQKAARESVSGTGDGIVGTIQTISTQLAGISLGQAPTGLNMMLAQLGHYNHGKALSLFNPDGSVMSPDALLREIADPMREAQKAGKAFAIGSQGGLDLDTINLTSLGRDGLDKALRSAQPNTLDPKQVKDAQDAANALNKVSDALDKLKNVLILDLAPAVTDVLNRLLAWVNYLRGDITAKERDSLLNESYDKTYGAGAAKRRDAHLDALDALPLVQSPQQPEEKRNWKRRAYDWLNPDATAPQEDLPPDWTNDQKIMRLQTLIAQGVSKENAARIVSAEIAGRVRPPSAAAISGGTVLGGGVTDALLDAVEKVESGGNRNAVSSKGALGAFQFMPDTAKRLGLADPTDPVASRATARQYINSLIAQFGSEEKGLAAYNWGPGNLGSDINQHGDQWKSFLPPETSAYLTKVASAEARGSSTDIAVNGPINIYPPSGDPHTIAKGVKNALIAQANTGPH